MTIVGDCIQESVGEATKVATSAVRWATRREITLGEHIRVESSHKGQSCQGDSNLEEARGVS